MGQSNALPSHVAIIMDGNGRWAKRRGKPRIFGHVRGAKRVREIVEEARRQGISALTLYAFSTENWNRPEGEVSALWKLLSRYLDREADALDRQGIRLQVIGERHRLDPKLQQKIAQVEDRLKHHSQMTLTLALSYGSRKEILNAVQKFAEDCLSRKTHPEELTESFFNTYLWTQGLGNLSDVDLVIRTSGEKRVSNFLLWQSAYAEYVFSEVCWPDFTVRHFRESLLHYSQRERRFGWIEAPRPSLTL